MGQLDFNNRIDLVNKNSASEQYWSKAPNLTLKKPITT